jgi:hypothetical protein
MESDYEDDQEQEFDYEDEQENDENEQELVNEVKSFERTSSNLFNINYTSSDKLYTLSYKDQFKIKIISLIKDFINNPKSVENELEILIDAIPYIKYKNPLAFLIAYSLTPTNCYNINQVELNKKALQTNAKKYKKDGISEEDIIRYSRLIVKYRPKKI